jgi:hypothetical protein
LSGCDGLLSYLFQGKVILYSLSHTQSVMRRSIKRQGKRKLKDRSTWHTWIAKRVGVVSRIA